MDKLQGDSGERRDARASRPVRRGGLGGGDRSLRGASRQVPLPPRQAESPGRPATRGSNEAARANRAQEPPSASLHRVDDAEAQGAVPAAAARRSGPAAHTPSPQPSVDDFNPADFHTVDSFIEMVLREDGLEAPVDATQRARFDRDNRTLVEAFWRVLQRSISTNRLARLEERDRDSALDPFLRHQLVSNLALAHKLRREELLKISTMTPKYLMELFSLYARYIAGRSGDRHTYEREAIDEAIEVLIRDMDVQTGASGEVTVKNPRYLDGDRELTIYEFLEVLKKERLREEILLRRSIEAELDTGT